MNTRIKILALLTSSVLLQACGGGGMLGTSDSDDYKLVPEDVTEDPTAARPSADAPVMKTNGTWIETPDGQRVILRGANLQYSDDPVIMIDGIAAIKRVGSSVVRIQLDPDMSPVSLEAALTRVAENNMVALLSVRDEALYCKDDADPLLDTVRNIWLGEFRDIIAQDRFQSNLMINIASGWGPESIFQGASTGYKIYTDTYKTAIRAFRKAGFKVPLVIDAPGCGADYHAFYSNRGIELLAADEEENLILSVHGYGSSWDSVNDIDAGISVITDQGLPVLMSEFGGSGVGEHPVKHKDIMIRGAGDYYAGLEVTWVDSSDKAGLLIPFAELVDITNTDVSFDIRVDDAYIDDGNMGVQMYVRDGNDTYANMGWVGLGSLTKETWNTLSYAIQDASSFSYVGEGFNLTHVTRVGIELIANGKPVDVGGAIDVDNFKIIEGSAPVELLNEDFTDDIDGWAVPWGEDSTLAYDASGVLEVTPAAASDAEAKQFVIQLTGIGDASGYEPETQIAARIFIPAVYAGDNLYFKFFNNESGWKQTTDVSSGFNVGGWTDIVVTTPAYVEDDPATPDVNEDPSFPTVANTLGIQFGGFTNPSEPFLIDDIVITGASGASDFVEGVQYESDFSSGSDGFAVLSWGNSGTVAADNGNLAFAVNEAASSRLTITKQNWNTEPLLDVTSEPFIIKTSLLIPESYSSLSEFRLQIFLQDSQWSNHFTAYELLASNASMAYGEWVDIEFQVE